MSTINKRLAALELAATAKNGFTVVYALESQPGVYWRAPYGCSYSGVGPVPEGVEVLNQAQVDALEASTNIITIEYVSKWRDEVQL